MGRSVALPREVGAGRLAHPDPLRTPAYNLELIDDPAVARITEGDTILGWQGDTRLALYVNMQWARWELWRLEHDGEYRYQASWPLADCRAVDIVGTVILHCLSHDVRRGFDPYLHVVARDNARRAAEQAKVDDQMGEAVERVAHALAKELK